MSHTAAEAQPDDPPVAIMARPAHAPAAGSRVPAQVAVGRVSIRKKSVMAVLMCATLAASTVVFPPASWWPLAYIFLAPWLVAVCACDTSRWVYMGSWLMGIGFFGYHVSWLMDVTMPGYAALCVAFGLVFPAVALPVRHMFRRTGASVALMFPLAWVALEYVRGLSLVGFPWLYLGHTHYKFPTMMQVADFAGVGGLSFVIAMCNGWVTDLLIQPFRLQGGHGTRRAVRLPLGSMATVLMLVGAFVYGNMRLSESAQARYPGPRVAIIQGDFPCTLTNSPINQVLPRRALDMHLTLARQAALEKPDLIVMPETVWASPLNREFTETEDLESIRTRAFPPSYDSSSMQFMQRICRDADQVVRAIALQSGATMVVGASALEWRPTEIPARVRRFNSVYVFPPTGETYVNRYDKMHLVMFGEFVPFRYSSLHTVYEWLNRLTPWGASGLEYSLDFGTEPKRFELTVAPRAATTAATGPASQPASAPGKTFRFATPVCYEDVVSGLIREFVTGPTGEKQVDLLTSVSNDGWFNHSTELEQHLAACAFRAVEFRVPIARSVNTGVSVFIDSNGHMHDKVRLSHEQTSRFGPLREVLTDMLSCVSRFASRGLVDPADAADRDALERLRGIVKTRLPSAIAAMPSLGPSQPSTRPAAGPGGVGVTPAAGNEYAYIKMRINEQFNHALTSARRDEQAAWRSFGDQLRADMDTLDRWTRQSYTAPGYRVADLYCDSRHSFYARWGDWFSMGCVCATVGMLVDWTIRRLQRPSRRQRRSAARAAAAARSAAATALLSLVILFTGMACVPSNNVPVLTAAERDSLERQSLTTLTAAALDDSAAVRVRAIEALQVVAPREGAGFFRQALSDEYAGVRFAALMAIGSTRQADALDAVRKLLDDPDPRVKPAVLFALHRLGDTRRTTELAALLLNHPRFEVRANAALALGRLGEANAVDVLKGALKDRDESVRLQALEAMLLLGSDHARRDLLTTAYNSVGQKTVFVLQALGRAKRTDAKQFCEYYAGPDGVHDEVRLAAVSALGQMGDRRGYAFALNRLTQYQPRGVDPADTPEQQAARVKTLACVALESIGNAGALGALRAAMVGDADMSVRVAAARAVLAIKR